MKKLNDSGVFHFWQLAAMSPQDAALVATDAKLGGRTTGWVAQSRSLLENA